MKTTYIDTFLQVHLLTGLGRYSEMMYVFDILKSNDKLNIIFEKQMADVSNAHFKRLFILKYV